MKNHKFEILNFPHFEDKRGTLTPFEFDKNFPFDVKRTYLVTAKEGQKRGGHAHLIEDEIFLASSGSLEVVLHDGEKEHKIVLDNPSKAVLVKKDCWHEFQNFSKDAVMLCFSSTHYLPGEKNYITSKKEFLKNKKI